MLPRPSSTSLRPVGVAIAMLTLGMPDVWAQPSTEPDATAHRRVFVPAETPGAWPTEGDRYLPLDSEEFDKLLDAVRENSEQTAPSARLRGAAYYAELIDEMMLVGSADLDVEVPSGKPRIFAMEAWNLAAESATWKGEDAERAQWGLWGRAAQRQVWGVLAQRSGTLQIGWRMRAATINDEQLEFELELPPAAPQTLELLLPTDYQAVLPSAELVRTQAHSDTMQRWLYQLAGEGPHRLKLLRQAAQAPIPQSRQRLSQATAYRLEPSGLDIASSFRLEAGDSTFELRCALTGGVQVKSVALDNQPVEWRVDGAQAESEIVIRVPASARPRELEVEALAPLVLDQPWRLPTIRARNAEWTEGTSLVVVSADLELQSFATESATLQHIVGLQPAAASAEAYRVQELSPEASLELRVTRLQPRLAVEAATAIDLGANETTARVAARVSSKYRSSYQIIAAISPGWSIESVKADPADALREWHVEEVDGQSVVQLQLNQPIRPGEPLQVEFDARMTRRRGGRPGSLLPAEVGKLRVLRFGGATTKRELALLRSRPQRQLELLHGLEAARIAAGELEAEERSLLPDPIVGEVIDLLALPDTQIVEVRPRRARYEVEVAAELTLLPQSASERFEITCLPLSGEISEVVLRFDQRLPESVQWTLLADSVGGGRTLVPTLGKTSEEDGARYVVKLPYESTGPVRLALSYSIPLQESTAYNAISFPQAVRWSGQVVVRGPVDGLIVEDAGWTPLGWPTVSGQLQGSLPVVGSYRLEADPLSRPTRLVIHRTGDAPETAPLAAWLAEYRSLQAADGSAIYSAVYHLENSGAAELEITLPQHTRLQASWLDGQQQEPRDFQADERTYRLRLTNAGRYPTLALQYVAQGPPLGRSTAIVPALPECSFPVRLNRWTLWTPEQFVPDDLITGYSARRVPWRERLFGPLARAAGQQAFLPWRADAWPQLWSTPVEELQTRLLAERFAERLEEQLAFRGKERWGALLSELAAAMRLEAVVFVDAVALRTAGIEPLAVVADDALPEGRQMAGHGLALVISPSRIVVTTSDRVAHWREQLQPTAAQRIFLVAEAELTLALDERFEQEMGEIVSLEAWLNSHESAASPWTDSFPSSLSDVGQRACTIEFIDDLPTVVVRRAYAQQAYWYVAWLAAVVGGTWWLGQRASLLILVLAVTAACCFVVPPHWLTIPQAAFVGLLSAVALRLVFGKSVLLTHERSTQTLVTGTTPAALIVGFVLAMSEMAGAPIAGDLPQVLVPIDSAGNRQGEDVYISAEYLDALQHAQGSSDHDGARYRMSEAVVRGNLRSTTPIEGGTSEPWSVSLTIETFVPHTEVELPLRQSDGEWLNELSSLDGGPVLLEWLPEGNGCRVEVLGSGTHLLKLVVQPNFTSSADRSLLKLHVPKIPGTHLELTVPAGFEDLEIARAGRIDRDASGLWRATLAPTETLTLDWARDDGRRSRRSGDVDQLTWLRVEQAVAHLGVQFHFREMAETPRTIDLDVSSGLKLLPPAADSQVERIEASAELPGVTRLHLKPGWEANPRLLLEFQLQRTSSSGKFFYPAVRLRGFTVERTLFAASVAADLSYHEQGADSLRGVSAAEFATAWGDSGSLPQFAYSISASESEWSMRVWPNPPTFSAEQSLAMHCESDGAQVEYRALVDQLTGRWLIHHMRCPAELEIEEIEVLEQPGGESLPMRWSQPQASHVTIFLGQPLVRPHIVRLKGRLRAAADGTVALPGIELAGAERGEVRLAVWRDPQVVASWVEGSDIPPMLTGQDELTNSAEILVGNFVLRAEDVANERRLQIEKNYPQFAVDTITTLGEDRQERTAKLHARVSVSRGVVSQLHLTVPKNLVEPFELRPKRIGTVRQVYEIADGRQVTLLLDQPVAAGNSLELEFVGRLSAPADGRVELPNLEVNEAVGGRRYVMLPIRWADRPIEWQTSGLRREPLPESLAHVASASSTELPYRVVGSRFIAEEPVYQGPLRNASVRHSWVEGVLDEHGKFSATASLLLQPGRASHCSLRLPAGARLLQIVADDQPASRQRLADGSWRLALGPPFLPRVIKISYLVEAENSGSRVRLAPPQVLIGESPLPISRTDWKINLVDGLRITEATLGRRIVRTKYAEDRHSRLVKALKDAAPLALETPVSEVRPWFAAWREHVELAESEVNEWGVETTSREAPPSASEKPSSWFELEQEMEEPAAPTTIPSSTYPPPIPQRPTSSFQDDATYLTSESAGQIEIVRAPLTAGNVWRWIAAAGLLAIGMSLERYSQGRPGWLDALGRWPHALAFVAGAVWWSLLAPSVLGLLMMLMAAISLAVQWGRIHRNWRTTDASTQLTARVS